VPSVDRLGSRARGLEHATDETIAGMARDGKLASGGGTPGAGDVHEPIGLTEDDEDAGLRPRSFRDPARDQAELTRGLPAGRGVL
jgi:hypothetical protein